MLPPPLQTDRHRRAFWDAYEKAHPLPPLRWGNTFARWRDVPGTELVVSYNISQRGVGIFVRGQRGVPVPETAAQLSRFSLELALGCPFGRPDFPFASWSPGDTFDAARWPPLHAWLAATGDRYTAILAEVVGSLA